MAVFYALNQTVSSIPDIFTTTLSIYCILCVVSYFQSLSSPQTLQTRTRSSPAPWDLTQDCPPTPGPVPDPQTPSMGGAGLTVSLPPDPQPPSYQSTVEQGDLADLAPPPVYDPPPPYPGSPTNEKK